MHINSPIDYFCPCKRFPFPRGRLDMVAIGIYNDERLEQRQKISLILCSNNLIQKLNRKFRKKNRPTDVLSFNYNDKFLLGEIYISLERAHQQARDYGHSHADEIVRLFVHGVFHLLGYDHETPADRRKMELKESKYCRID
jgi:probable rRNA maturation factor